MDEFTWFWDTVSESSMLWFSFVEWIHETDYVEALDLEALQVLENSQWMQIKGIAMEGE